MSFNGVVLIFSSCSKHRLQAQPLRGLAAIVLVAMALSVLLVRPVVKQILSMRGFTTPRQMMMSSTTSMPGMEADC